MNTNFNRIEWINPSNLQSRIVVSLEQLEYTNGLLGCDTMPYTSAI